MYSRNSCQELGFLLGFLLSKRAQLASGILGKRNSCGIPGRSAKFLHPEGAGMRRNNQPRICGRSMIFDKIVDGQRFVRTYIHVYGRTNFKICGGVQVSQQQQQQHQQHHNTCTSSPSISTTKAPLGLIQVSTSSSTPTVSPCESPIIIPFVTVE
jgi:hypothetical protein